MCDLRGDFGRKCASHVRRIGYARSMALRGLTSAGWLVGVIALVVSAPSALANKSAMEFFEPVATHRHFTDYVRQFDLDRQQRMIVELVFEDYTDAIRRLADEADRAADEVGRQTVIAAFAGRQLVDPAELRRLREDVLEVYRGYWPQVDRQFANMIDGVHSLLLDEQRNTTTGPLRQLRRAMLLHPRDTSRRSYEYAGDGVDVLLLLQAARHESSELAEVPDDSLEDIREAYEASLDSLLTETTEAHRANRMDKRLARIRRDATALNEAERVGLELWSQLYELNARTVEQIALVAESNLGQDEADQWRARFRQACFPWMFTEGATDRRYGWLMRQQLSDQQIARANRVYQEFQDAQEKLRLDAIELMLKARTQMHCIVYAMMARSEIRNDAARRVHDQLLRNSGQLASVEAEATAGFESLLDDHQRAAMRRAMRR